MSLAPAKLVRASVNVLNPICRVAIQRRIMAKTLWNDLVSPRLCWRDYSFTCKASFGARITGNTQDVLQRCIFYFGVFDPAVVSLIQRRFTGGTFLDIGANIGYISLLAAQKADEVIAIEPNSAVVAHLQQNLALNKTQNVRVIRTALSNSTKTVRLFYQGAENCGASSLYRPTDSYEDVRAVPLPELLSDDELRRITFVKVDVEGSEQEILEAIDPAMDKFPANVQFLVELSPEFKNGEPIVNQMQSHGFYAYTLPLEQMEFYFDNSPKMALPYSGLQGRMDVLFTRERVDMV